MPSNDVIGLGMLAVVVFIVTLSILTKFVSGK